MKNYIRQLIEDLLAVAKNPPKPTWIEPPPHLENDAIIAELALVPFKTIEELTGIKQEVFPEMDQLQILTHSSKIPVTIMIGLFSKWII
ncbi:MAG: hypothetical protein K0B11_09925 [Mariniphaga sp.]|nr:hypothetical protein [Mariniphaga sp.]